MGGRGGGGDAVACCPINGCIILQFFPLSCRSFLVSSSVFTNHKKDVFRNENINRVNCSLILKTEFISYCRSLIVY